MNGKVLILGNGISRLQPTILAAIDAWDGELWGCNRAYREYGMRLSRLTGHIKALIEAQAWKDAHEAPFKIWGGNLEETKPGWHRFTCPGEFLKDSGTTLVAQSLHEQRPEIVCAGFDLGGLDVGSPGMDKQDKSVWVRRWRDLSDAYAGLPTVRFLGHDHKPFILGAESRRAYAKLYLAGKPHIKDPEYVRTFHAFQVATG